MLSDRPDDRSSGPAFRAVQEDMVHATDALRAKLAEAIYQSSARPYTPVYLAWHRRAWRAVRWYLTNLWDALCGRAPEYDEFD